MLNSVLQLLDLILELHNEWVSVVLHLLGLEHERLTYRHQGLDFRLTGVEPSRVVREILA